MTSNKKRGSGQANRSTDRQTIHTSQRSTTTNATVRREFVAGNEEEFVIINLASVRCTCLIRLRWTLPHSPPSAFSRFQTVICTLRRLPFESTSCGRHGPGDSLAALHIRRRNKKRRRGWDGGGDGDDAPLALSPELRGIIMLFLSTVDLASLRATSRAWGAAGKLFSFSCSHSSHVKRVPPLP